MDLMPFLKSKVKKLCKECKKTAAKCKCEKEEEKGESEKESC